MKSNKEILGQRAACSRVALMAIRHEAWEMYCDFSALGRYPLSQKQELEVIFAAEEELLFWPMSSPQEAAMI
jgi:hypothetical protein